MPFTLSRNQLIESISLWDKCKCEKCQKEVDYRRELLKEFDNAPSKKVVNKLFL